MTFSKSCLINNRQAERSQNKLSCMNKTIKLTNNIIVHYTYLIIRINMLADLYTFFFDIIVNKNDSEGGKSYFNNEDLKESYL